jgi:hypothetical protein
MNRPMSGCGWLFAKNRAALAANVRAPPPGEPRDKVLLSVRSWFWPGKQGDVMADAHLAGPIKRLSVYRQPTGTPISAGSMRGCFASCLHPDRLSPGSVLSPGFHPTRHASLPQPVVSILRPTAGLRVSSSCVNRTRIFSVVQNITAAESGAAGRRATRWAQHTHAAEQRFRQGRTACKQWCTAPGDTAGMSLCRPARPFCIQSSAHNSAGLRVWWKRRERQHPQVIAGSSACCPPAQAPETADLPAGVDGGVPRVPHVRKAERARKPGVPPGAVSISRPQHTTASSALANPSGPVRPSTKRSVSSSVLAHRPPALARRRTT